ncbi:hypothetical protein [Lapillicoccus sp.]|uniref:hypothetical protein n=1 Tax=Lapillicoccus sp. TaxID=1909287 RepID=UPI0025F65A04|nr:hypothetical protein [Lapillicoccus sp.]
MNDASRRGFLALTGTGVAGAAAIAVAQSASAAPARAAAETTADGPMVAHVRNIHTGEVAVMIGEREVVVHDKALVSALAKHLKTS